MAARVATKSSGSSNNAFELIIPHIPRPRLRPVMCLEPSFLAKVTSDDTKDDKWLLKQAIFEYWRGDSRRVCFLVALDAQDVIFAWDLRVWLCAVEILMVVRMNVDADVLMWRCERGAGRKKGKIAIRRAANATRRRRARTRTHAHANKRIDAALLLPFASQCPTCQQAAIWLHCYTKGKQQGASDDGVG